MAIKQVIPEIFEEIAKYVAESFMADMREEGCDSFMDMANKFWWTAKDVKEEIDYKINEYAEKVGKKSSIYLSDDGADVWAGGDFITYRKFSTLWRKYLKDNWRTDNDKDSDEEDSY